MLKSQGLYSQDFANQLYQKRERAKQEPTHEIYKEIAADLVDQGFEPYENVREKVKRIKKIGLEKFLEEEKRK